MKAIAIAAVLAFAFAAPTHAETWWEKRGCIPYDDGGAQGLVFCPMVIDPDTKEIVSREWIGPKKQTGGTMMLLRDRVRVDAVEARERAREESRESMQRVLDQAEQDNIRWQLRLHQIMSDK